MFTGCGASLFLGGLVAGRRRYEIRAASGQLQIDRFGPFGHRTFAWNSDEIRQIKVADSGTKINGRSLQQVKIIPKPGKSHLGMMTGRAATELASVAAALRDSLALKGK
jgi:hypothetical protein